MIIVAKNAPPDALFSNEGIKKGRVVGVLKRFGNMKESYVQFIYCIM